jgi:hypothetical protein
MSDRTIDGPTDEQRRAAKRIVSSVQNSWHIGRGGRRGLTTDEAIEVARALTDADLLLLPMVGPTTLAAFRAVHGRTASDEGRCASCRWWASSKDSALSIHGEIGACLLADTRGPGYRDDGPVPDHPESKAWAVSATSGVCDELDEYSVLWTRPDFGCVQWEAKP